MHSLVTCWDKNEVFLTESELERLTDKLRVREIFLDWELSAFEEGLNAPLNDHVAFRGFCEPPTYIINICNR